MAIDLDPGDLDLIEAVFAGRCEGLSPWQEAQARELAFWRWVAFHGYDGKDPLMFPLFQRALHGFDLFYRTGWAMAEFRAAAILELGCGPLGMIEYVPGARRVAFDPLNDGYGRLFGNFRSRGVNPDYISVPRLLLEETGAVRPGNLSQRARSCRRPGRMVQRSLRQAGKTGGRLSFQVNLSNPGRPCNQRASPPAPLAAHL